MNEQPRLTVSHAYWISACLLSDFPHGTQSRSLLLHQSVKFVFAKLTFDTLCRAFVATHQLCTAILAAIPPTRKIQNSILLRPQCYVPLSPLKREPNRRPGSLYCCSNVLSGAITPPQHDNSTECVCWNKLDVLSSFLISLQLVVDLTTEQAFVFSPIPYN